MNECLSTLRGQSIFKALVGSSHRPGPRPQRPQDFMARRCHHADRGDGGICPRRLDRPRLANRPRFHALPADAVRWLLFHFAGLILLLLGVCFLREAPERAIGSDQRAGKWGVPVIS